MKVCTWKDCNREANHPQISKDGKEWANLCYNHYTELIDSMRSDDPGKILHSWVLAQGGAKIAASRILREPNKYE